MRGPSEDPERNGGDDAVERLFERGDRSARAVRDTLVQVLPSPLLRVWRAAGRWLNRRLPKGLLARALLILVVPIVIFQTILAFVFMERHWELVTSRLSDAVSRDVAAVVDLVEALPPDADTTALLTVARQRLQVNVTMGPAGPLAPDTDAGFGDALLIQTLTEDLSRRLDGPFRVARTGDRTVVVETETQRGPLTARFDRNLAYAANWHIFLVWMVSTSLVLTGFSVLFLRNQIKPILRLARAAEAFGRGRPADGFVPQGAREVRRASQAFIAMRRRIERQIEQRTTMLAGVSHDLRTMLTRLKLELAMMPPGPEADAMARDLDEMNAMLEAYMSFAKGDPDEETETVDLALMIAEIADRHARSGGDIAVDADDDLSAAVRPAGFRRLVDNLVGNAVKYGDRVAVRADLQDGWLTVLVDDDGPGIPEDQREAVFRPFFRLDAARNQDRSGTGLGLAIARDVARAHGGDVRVEDSPFGGARVIARIPV